MLAFDRSDTIEGISVYEDHADPRVFYLLPNQPRFRLDEQKRPVFKFIKYRFPVDRSDGKKGGGFVIFDVEFSVSDELREKIRGQLQERLDQRFRNANPKPQVILGQLRPISTSTLGKPAVTVQFLGSNGALVEKIQNPVGPALFGNFITPVTVELTPEGATLCEQALQGRGGIIQISYNLPMVVRLPALSASVHFWSQKFMSFHQEVNIGTNIWGTPRSRRERTEEFFSDKEFASVDINPGMVTDQKVIAAVRDWGWSTLEDAVKRMLLSNIDPVKDDQKKVDESLRHLTRDIVVQKVVDFHRTYRENMNMDWDPTPGGTLPNITNIPGVQWSDYAIVVDLDDPFFKQLNLSAQPNVDFQNLPIHSIDVHVEYPKQGGAKEVKDFNFKKEDDIGHFNVFLDNNSRKYKYSYKVNYRGESKVFQAPLVESEETSLTINVGDTGIITADLSPGDIDWEVIRAAQVSVRYEPRNAPAVEKQFTLDKDHPNHRFQEVVFETVDKPYQYKVKYLMKDGKEFEGDWRSSEASTLIVNDVFSAIKTVGLRARGNLETDVEVILVDLVYEDAVNKYTQTKSTALDSGNNFFDWTFPVISETGGKVTYSGTIKYRNNAEEDIPPTEATGNTILVGPKIAGFLEVSVLPDLIDFDQVKLARISLHYTDSANAIDVKKDFTFKLGAANETSFKVELKDKTKTSYEWRATFFLNDGSKKEVPPRIVEELTLIPQLSDAV